MKNPNYLPRVLMSILQDVYLRPHKRKTLTAHSRYLWKLYDAGMVTSKDGVSVVITSRGKNYLKKNIELLTPEEEHVDLLQGCTTFEENIM